MISPTVGRVVWYRPSENDNRVAMAVRQPRRFAETGDTESPQPLAALVTYVFGDREVNLVIFDHDGSSYGRQHVHLVQEGDEIPSGSYCQWMPYQVGQAKKHEAPSAPAIDIGGIEERLADQIRTVFDNMHKHFTDLFRARTTPIVPIGADATALNAGPAAGQSAADKPAEQAGAAPAA